MEITLSEISRRLLFRYYPVWLICAVLTCYRFKLLNLVSNIKLTDLIVGSQLVALQFFILSSVLVVILKPKRLFTRLIAMTLPILIFTLIHHMVPNFFYDFVPVPFLLPTLSTQVFFSWLTTGFFIIWFFFIAEQSLISEKQYAREKTNRLLTEKNLVKSRLSLLQAQIEPQFMFNTMIAIVQMFDKDLEKARTMQMVFIQYLRATLVKTRGSETTVGEEMELIRAYMDLFKVSMGGRLLYKIHIDPEVNNLPFPSMLIQPIVENAIKHGLEPKPEGGSIFLSVLKEDNLLHVNISDTGVGVRKSNNMGQGLSNVNERINSLFGDRGRIDLEENLPSGMRVILKVPYA